MQAFLIDGHGGLFEFAGGRRCQKIELSARNNEERVLHVGNCSIGRWVVTDSYFTFRFTHGDLVGEKRLGPMPLYGRLLPVLAESFCLEAPDRVLIVIRGKDRYFCVDVRGRVFDDFAIPVKANLYSGWVSPNGFMLAGGSLRNVADESIISEWGEPVLVDLSRETGDNLSKIDVTSIKKKISQLSAPRHSLVAQIHLEAVLAAEVVGKEKWCLFPVQYGEPNHDAEWFFDTRIRWTDFREYVLVACDPDGGMQLLDHFENVNYSCSVNTGIAKFLYFPRTTKIVNSKVEMLCVIIDSNSGSYVAHDSRVTFDLEGDQVCYIRMYHTAELGFFGCVGAFTRAGYVYSLMVSDDGVHWQSTGELSRYAR
jgi:hypothetical protein